jgi:hypothetical protein
MNNPIPIKELGLLPSSRPDLTDDYEYNTAMFLANIYTLTRELVGANLTDNQLFTVDKVYAEMLECVERFFEATKKESGG